MENPMEHAHIPNCFRGSDKIEIIHQLPFSPIERDYISIQNAYMECPSAAFMIQATIATNPEIIFHFKSVDVRIVKG